MIFVVRNWFFEVIFYVEDLFLFNWIHGNRGKNKKSYLLKKLRIIIKIIDSVFNLKNFKSYKKN